MSGQISIHAPSEGSDMNMIIIIAMYIQFQSTLPAKGATKRLVTKNNNDNISIHAPSEGSDQ